MNLDYFNTTKAHLVRMLMFKYSDQLYSTLRELFLLQYKSTNLRPLDKLITTLQDYRTSLEIINILDTTRYTDLNKEQLQAITLQVQLATNQLTEELMIELSTDQQNKMSDLIELTVLQSLIESDLACF